MPTVPSWLLEPLWDQFAALLPGRPVYDPSHPLGCHKPRIADRIILEKLIQLLRFGCSYASIADCTCGAITIREHRDEWIKAWHNGFNRLQRCYERREEVIDAFFDFADAIITVRRLIREGWTLYRWVGRPARSP